MLEDAIQPTLEVLCSGVPQC